MLLEVEPITDAAYPFSEDALALHLKKQDVSTSNLLELQETDRNAEMVGDTSFNPLASQLNLIQKKPNDELAEENEEEEQEEEDVVNELQALPSESLRAFMSKNSSVTNISRFECKDDRLATGFASNKISIGNRDNFGRISKGLFFEGSPESYETEDKEKKIKLDGKPKTAKAPRKLPALLQSDAEVIRTAEVVLKHHIKAGKVVIRSSQIPVPYTFAKKTIRYGRMLEAIFYFTKSCFSRGFELYLKEEVKQLISCRKESFTLNSRFIMGLNNEELGEVKGNFWGSYYNIFQDSMLVGTIRFLWACSRSDNQIEIFLKNDEFAPEQIEGYSLETPLSEIYEYGSNLAEKKIKKFINKKPQFNIQTGVYSLNFYGLARVPSSKNILLIEEKTGSELLLVAKKDESHFNIRMSHPLSVRTGMSILAALFDSKLVSE